MDDLPSWLNTALGALGGLSVGGYSIHRIYRRDKHNDATDDKSQKLIDNLCRQLDSERESFSEQIRYERENNLKLGETIDRLAGERNDAVQKVGRLEGQVVALQDQVTRLQNEVEKLERVNNQLIEQVISMRDEVVAMGARISRSEAGA